MKHPTTQFYRLQNSQSSYKDTLNYDVKVFDPNGLARNSISDKSQSGLRNIQTQDKFATSKIQKFIRNEVFESKTSRNQRAYQKKFDH